VALKDDGKRGAVVGGDGEIAALVELSRREAGPVAVDAATADAAAQHPDDVPVAMVGAAIAVLVNCPTELGEHHDNAVVPVLVEPLGQRGEAVAQRSETIGELAFLAPLIDVGVPAAEAGKGESDVPVLPDQMGKPRRLVGKLFGGRARLSACCISFARSPISSARAARPCR
jgi:hypothetical protein